MKFAERSSTHRILRIAAAAFIALFVRPIHAQSKIEKEAAVLKYKDKFLLVKNDGIVVNHGHRERGECVGAVMIINDAKDIKVIDRFNCGVEPIHKGEALKVVEVRLAKQGYLVLGVENLSPHSVTRGIGVFAHPTLEVGRAIVEIRAGKNGSDFSSADALAAQWFTLLDGTNPADAARLGNTASGIFVDQVKSGMSFAEVESALGVPQTRVDLGEKVLYRYKDLTVEFHDGKVTDVR